MQRQLQRQQVLLNNGAGGLNAAMAANKKQREVYVGNLVIGSVSDLMLRELFNAALAHFVADPVTRPPVVSVTMDGSGRFGFVELRTEELAAEAMKLDKVNLGGRDINVGRPKGYIEPPPGSVRDPNEVRTLAHASLGCCWAFAEWGIDEGRAHTVGCQQCAILRMMLHACCMFGMQCSSLCCTQRLSDFPCLCCLHAAYADALHGKLAQHRPDTDQNRVRRPQS
jgi:hypothetical protein